MPFNIPNWGLTKVFLKKRERYSYRCTYIFYSYLSCNSFGYVDKKSIIRTKSSCKICLLFSTVQDARIYLCPYRNTGLYIDKKFFFLLQSKNMAFSKDTLITYFGCAIKPPYASARRACMRSLSDSKLLLLKRSRWC